MAWKDIEKALLITSADLKSVKEFRRKSIQDAIDLKKGPSLDNQSFHRLWKWGKFEVGVAKPGKETIRKKGIVNPNDMLPFIKESGAVKPDSASFRDIFRDLEQEVNKSPRALELLGCLFVRSAYLLDYKIDAGRVVYNPPDVVTSEIKKDIPALFGVPLEVFLQYAEAIALNEEVKYDTRGKIRRKPYGRGAGRENNLLSCAHLIAVLLKRQTLVDFAYGFSMMRGVSPMNKKQARTFFPLLGEEGLIERKKRNKRA